MNRGMKKLVKSPFALMEFGLTAQLPSHTKRTQTPLVILLNKIPAKLRLQMKEIQLSPKLGYTNSHRWGNAQQLLKWAESVQGDSWSIKAFNQSITLEKLLEHSRIKPNPNLLARFQKSVR